MEAEHILSAPSAEHFPAETVPEIAFLGRSNVGKSSLLNALTGKRNLAYTSSRPGCTQLINFYRVGEEWRFVDLPGYGFAQVPMAIKLQWKGLIESYLMGRKALKLAAILLDARRGWMQHDLDLKIWLEHRQLAYLVVATKIDKLNVKEQHRNLGAIRKELDRPEELYPFSAITGRGAREIWQAISKTKNKL